MKALTYSRYGTMDVLSHQELPKPTPNDDEVLIKVHAATVNRTDNAAIKGIPFFVRIVSGLFSPKKRIPGSDFAGTIEAVGNNVSAYQVGDAVFGFHDMGAKSHAEYLTIGEANIQQKPENISFEQAAACCEGAHYAYNFINKVDVSPGKSVLVNGGTGAIGSAAVQLCKHFGADVSAVCATEQLDQVSQLGADRVFDYLKEDFTQTDAQYDYIFDAVGKSSLFKCKRILKPGGVYISSDLGYLWQNIYLPMITPLVGNKISKFPVPDDIPATLQLLKTLVEQGEFSPLIDRIYPFDEIIDAYRYVEKGEKIGNVVIRFT